MELVLLIAAAFFALLLINEHGKRKRYDRFEDPANPKRKPKP